MNCSSDDATEGSIQTIPSTHNEKEVTAGCDHLHITTLYLLRVRVRQPFQSDSGSSWLHISVYAVVSHYAF